MREMPPILNARRLAFASGLAFTLMLLVWFRFQSPGSSTTLPPLTGDGLHGEAGRPPSSVPIFSSGKPKAPGLNYTRTLVIGRLPNEDVSWISRDLPDIKTAIYIVGQDTINKGHEAMVYLTYIIDHYDDLADTSIFFHPHLTTWHNNDLLDSNAANTIRHLSDAHVARVGYFNSRCHEEPGCPDWLHLDRPKAELDPGRKMEEEYFTPPVWKELHGSAPVPSAISQPCCAQFMVSRERIRAHPRTEYIRYREWVTNTNLTDEMAGRIMEYTWQYIWTGEAEVCPQMNRCYCDGYGVCFGGKAPFDEWFAMRDLLRASPDGTAESRTLSEKLEKLKREAFERGMDPKNRAQECGRAWKVGDGY